MTPKKFARIRAVLIAIVVLAAMIAIALLIQALVHWHPGGNGAPRIGGSSSYSLGDVPPNTGVPHVSSNTS